jgi:hypothetical protein
MQLLEDYILFGDIGISNKQFCHWLQEKRDLPPTIKIRQKFNRDFS